MTSLNQPSPEKTAADKFLLELRSATAPLHQALEQSPLSTALLHPNVSVTDYAAYLKKMEPVVKFTDEVLLPLLHKVLPDATERKKHHWLAQDLLHLKEPVDQYNFTPNHFSESLPAALGFFYVVEGSTLGGRVLLKHLRNRFSIDASTVGRFFSGYGEETSAMWKRFLTAFCDYAVSHNCEAEITASAQRAFQTIRQHFNTDSWR